MYPISGCLQIMLAEQRTASDKQLALKKQKLILGKRFS